MNKAHVLLLLFACVACMYAELPPQVSPQMLMIVADQFYSDVLPLAEWKCSKGIPTKVVTMSEVGETQADIRWFINCEYTLPDTPALRYVLLVGAPEEIPAYAEQHGDQQCATDCWYASTTGDYPMELSIGRLPVKDTSECQAAVAKLLAYERPAPEADSGWFKKGTTVVAEDDPADSFYQPDSRLAREYWLGEGFEVADSLMDDWGDDSLDVIAAVNDGRLFLTYRGSGVGWWGQFAGIDPTAWTNGAKLPVVIAGTCQTVTLNIGESMYGDTFVRAGSAESLGGAIAYFGTTVAWHWISEYRSACFRGFFDALYDERCGRLGEATVYGREQVVASYPQCDTFRYVEWNLLGDPSMYVWLGGVPETVVVVRPETLPANGSAVSVTVTLADDRPVKNALVCLRKDPDLYTSARTDSNGVAQLPLPNDYAEARSR